MNRSDIADREMFRFTGPPENWLTAIKFMTWGLEEKHLERWQKIEAGDIFLMHSTTTNTVVKGAPSSVIGFGVVSPDFSKKDGPLWVEEIRNGTNKWPLLVPFSEVYLFSELRPYNTLEAPNNKNYDLIIHEAKELLTDAIKLPEGFPQMGSFSSVRPEVVLKVFESAKKFYLYNSIKQTGELFVSSSGLKETENVEDVLKVRKPATLAQLDVVKKKTIRKGTATFTKDLQTLEKAEDAHQNTLRMLFDLLKRNGFVTYYNRHVDLFATKHNDSYLFEIKSLSNKNFRSQARKGIVQLFEYEYFEIKKFFEVREQMSAPRPEKALIFSAEPKDENYVNFISNLKLGSGYFDRGTLKSAGFSTALKHLENL